MTYLNFLLLFVVLPTCLLIVLFQRHLTRHWLNCVGAMCIIAVVWTTPWDNYLVANNVWWYDKDLVLNIIIGYVPIEEYAFFVLQTLMTSLLFAGVLGVITPPNQPFRARYIDLAIFLIMSLILLVMIMLASGESKFNYLILEIGWLALPPLAIQWLFGLDIILYRWKVILISVLIPTLWLTAMDSVAIGAGTWSISKEQTLGIQLGGIVPIEEAIFFLITNLLIVQGISLLYLPEGWTRVEYLVYRRLNLDKKLNKYID